MPRYLLETQPAGRDEARTAVAVAAERYPELAVEHLFAAGDRDGEPVRALWVCRAPSATHVRRWARAARLIVRAVTAVRSDHQP